MIFFYSDYTATIDEEAKNAVRKLNKEKEELKRENESLKKKVLDHGQQLTARSSV
jgi:cell division protein FtsB